jgi:hypothetical protein
VADGQTNRLNRVAHYTVGECADVLGSSQQQTQHTTKQGTSQGGGIENERARNDDNSHETPEKQRRVLGILHVCVTQNRPDEPRSGRLREGRHRLRSSNPCATLGEIERDSTGPRRLHLLSLGDGVVGTTMAAVPFWRKQ